MALHNDQTRYGWLNILLHWAVGIPIIILLILGWIMINLDRDDLETIGLFYTIHKSLGYTLFPFVALRAAWFLCESQPQMLGNPPPWQYRLARLNHWGLLVCMLVMVVSGWLLSDTSKYPATWFWLFDIPDLLPINDTIHDINEQIHLITAWITSILVGIHILAALKHHFIDRDRTLLRMLGKP